ncbi:MAG: GNAT family N-acetyltransferase [Actinomycetota bacterium]|nr:GNAT family N-acetyltransferase [Actinomycetota bacterium]
MTDLLGICTSWGQGVCVVQPEAGPPVTIALADIVSGKPVPPRASVRARVSPREAQVRAFALFPDLETESVGDWVLRRSAGHSARRANSALAFGPSGVAGDVDRVEEFYDRPVAAVLPDSPEDELFRGRGWVLESHDADTVFMVGSVAMARRGCRDRGIARSEQVELEETGSSGATARIEQQASGVAAYADDWVGFRAIEVAPEHRRQGLGLAVMDALLEWGAEQGATTAYLQVIGDNEAALRLYEGLGFREHHRYRYLTPG